MCHFVKFAETPTTMFNAWKMGEMKINKNNYLTVRAYAGKTRWIVYIHQQVETMECRSDISQKNLFFKNII